MSLTKKCYIGGFLYHPDSQKILLQQNRDGEKQIWGLLGGVGERNFHGAVTKVLKLKLHPKAVLPIYDYAFKGEKRFISYVEVEKLVEFPATKTYSFKWFTIKEISKLPLSVQTKQDITVGRRVIDSQIRKEAGERVLG